MPHVVLKGKTTVENIFKKLETLFIRNKAQILKTNEMYLERGKNSILIDSLAIEGKVKTSFLSMISGREDGVVIRLYPRIEVEKTNGVKQILAEIANNIKTKFPELRIEETNLAEYLK